MKMSSYVVGEYAKRFYTLLKERAELNEYQELVFKGSLTKAFKQIGASSSYYSPIRKLLLESGSIEITQRGAGSQLSEVRVNELNENIFSEPLTGGSGRGTVGVDELGARVARLEAWRETTGGLNIAEALRNIEDRVLRLESLTGGKNGKK